MSISLFLDLLLDGVMLLGFTVFAHRQVPDLGGATLITEWRFDMDGTLLNGRFVLELAQRTGRMEALNPLLDNQTLEAVVRTRRIAAILAGVPRKTFERVARDIPFMPGAVGTVVRLRKAGYLVGVVTAHVTCLLVTNFAPC